MGKDTHLDLSLGDYVRIPCDMYGSTLWLFSDGQLPLNANIDEYKSYNKSALIIENVLSANQGVYSCLFKNKFYISTIGKQ